ncbi:hypothetical protein PsYK624_139970 [Phanerochaete sordida]|uniref:Zinc-finger domain-containing protein n=1 Tax=Phanerochaete sordida TaxID=48140 RepID=A0A9P3GMK7_9APHY|nr:hypothetical protein PsYK624_139970 [Phanerochaete sordida]
MSDKTKAPPPISRRRSQVFVDVPLSTLQRRNSDDSSTGPSLKENTPLRPSKTNSQAQVANVASTSKLSKKRKTGDNESTETQLDTAKSKTKKSKLDSAAPQSDDEESAQSKKLKAVNSMKARTKQDDDTFRCHHCQRWWPNGQGLRCTLLRTRSKTRKEQCTSHYCFSCIQKYHRLESLDSILAHDVTELSKEQRQDHAVESGRWFKCYRCIKECDCHVCRRARDLEPIGNLKLKARQAEKAEKAQAKEPNAGSSSQMKAKKVVTKNVDKASKAADSAPSKAPKATPKPKPKPKAVTKPKDLPRPVWTRIPTDLALEDVETRLHIREFMVRFGSVLQMPHSHLDELEEISGDNLGPAGGWDVDLDDSFEIIGWVSELCARSIIQALLGAIASWAGAEGDDDAAAALREAVKAVKASGSNLNRVWGSLVSLREALGHDTILSFSDPLPTPASAAVRTTRSAMHGNDAQAVYISSSAQLVPVIASLIEHAMLSPPVREAFDIATADDKELSKLAKEATTKENTRWKGFAGTKDKQRRDQHNRLLRNIDFSQRLASARYVPRWAPLGQDAEGRVYYAMTPGIGESDAAIDFLNGKDTRVKVGRKREWNEEDRGELARWSWFVAVWGKKPADAEEAEREDDDNEERDQNADAWWAFWQPAELQKLAEWLAIKNGLDQDPEDGNDEPEKRTSKKAGSRKASSGLSRDASPLSELSDLEDDDVMMKTDGNGHQVPVKRELETLVRGLREYTGMLEWRIQRASRERTASPEPEKSGKKSKKSSPAL